MVTLRIRSIVWFVTGAVLATATTLMFVQAWRVDAAPGDVDTTLVPITPCRLVDTRQPGQVPLGAGETRTIDAHGTNGPPGSPCTIPADAVGLSMNVTALDASTIDTFITIWEDGVARPNASSLNPAPGLPPTPNAVNTPLSASGRFNVFNFVGTVQVLVDVNGYYTKASLSELAGRLIAVEGIAAANSSSIATLDAREPFAVSGSTPFQITALTSSPAAFVSVTVTAPAAGRVTVNSTARVFHGSDGASVFCAIVEATAIPPLGFNSSTPSLQEHETSLLSRTGSLAGTRTFDLAAGATVTYSLACYEGLDGGAFFAGNLTAVFTPAP